MKQSFGKTLMSCFLTVTLMASVLAGAISVSCSSAKADTVSQSDVMYFDDVISSITNLGVFTQSQLDGFFGYVAPFVRDIEENSMYMVCVCHDTGTNNWAVQLFSCAATIYSYQFSSGGNTYHGLSSANGSAGSTKFRCRASLFTNGSNNNYIYYDANISVSDYLAKRTAINFDTVPGYQYVDWYGYPNAVDFAVSGRMFWISHDVAQGNDSWSASKNLFYGSIPTIGFELVKFKLGERTYLTTRDQNIIFNTQPLEDTYLWWYIGFMQEDGSDYDNVVLMYQDLTLIPGASAWLNVGLQNIHSQGVLAYDITDLLTWHDIWLSEFFWIYDPPTGNPAQYTPYAEASNVPFLLGDDPGGQSDSYTQAWDQFNTYVTNYNTTHVIPEQLGDWLFETNGSKLFPCNVQVPTSIWYNKFQTTSAPDNHIWRWGGGLIQEEGFQYSLFDTVIVGESDSGYGIRYFYSDTLSPSYNYIDEMLFENLIDSFDVVIIVPESEGILYEIPGVDVGAIGYTGSSSAGVIYTNDTLIGNTLQGFCILTERAIAKQQLWNFNEGITKLYDLEVDYIDSEDKWKDSFLLWSASMFDMVNSLDGHLSDIVRIISGWDFNNYVERITDRLDELINNTGELEWDFWYMSLFSWVNQFRPSNSDFTAGLEQFDNNWEDFPELPAPSTVPLLPTIGG